LTSSKINPTPQCEIIYDPKPKWILEPKVVGVVPNLLQKTQVEKEDFNVFSIVMNALEEHFLTLNNSRVSPATFADLVLWKT
jgi:hypothetical protein